MELRPLDDVPEHRVAMRREDRFRVELEAGLKRRGVADRHRHAFIFGVDAEVRRRVGGAEAVVAADVHRAVETFERADAVMIDDDRLAMHGFGRAGDGAAGLLNQSLMAETHAEQRRLALGETDQFQAAAGVVIRSAVVVGDTAYVRAGAGVVYDSDPQREADETRRKASAILSALAASGEKA